MFVTLNQFYLFIACVAFGGVVGVIYTPILLVKEKVGSLILEFFLDFIYFFCIAFLFSKYSFSLHFPSLRGYMIAGVFLGIILYVKSFHITLAKVCKRVYNILKKNFHSKVCKDDRRKNEKINNIDDDRGSASIVRANIGYGVPTYRNKGGKKSRVRVR